jgi:hypothetical protein
MVTLMNKRNVLSVEGKRKCYGEQTLDKKKDIMCCNFNLVNSVIQMTCNNGAKILMHFKGVDRE